MSSTTERSSERGQILTVFAFSIIVIMLVAAMAFDVGMVLVEQRDQQNAADAAAIAGARFLPDDVPGAIAAAAEIARRNGFDDGVNSANVDINVPPTAGAFTSGGNSFIEVIISSTRPSVFAGVIGRNSWGVGSRAVAANQNEEGAPFALLSLHPDACPALLIEGTGVLNSAGNIQVNSECPSANPGSFRIAGEGVLNLTASGVGCNIAGVNWTEGGGVGVNDCDDPNLDALTIEDPLADRPYPQIPMDTASPPNIVYPTTPLQVAGTTRPVPVGCPGSTTPATDSVPASCRFGGSYAGTTWRLYPGYYPGGINLESGTFYLEPGIYHVAGGFDPGGGVGNVSFRAAGSGVSLISTYAGGETVCNTAVTPQVCGGIMIFNDRHTTLPDGKIVLQGASAAFTLYPLSGGTPWDNIVIFQHRDITETVMIEGGASAMEVRGIIYAPNAHVSVRGNAGTLTMDQVIGSTFEVRGNGGTINLAFDPNFTPDFTVAGLVE